MYAVGGKGKYGEIEIQSTQYVKEKRTAVKQSAKKKCDE